MVIAGWMVACAVTLVHSATQLQTGVDAIARVRGEVSTQDLADNRAAGDLHNAVGHFGRAHAMLDDPWLAPLGIVPYAGRQLRSTQALASAAYRVAQAGNQTLDQAHTLLDAPRQTPAERADLIRQMAAAVATLSRRTDHIDLGPANALLPALAAKRAAFATDLAKLRTGLDRGAGATAALADLLGGPRTYLVLAANNAEMRDGSGMFLDAGTLSTDNGTLTFAEFGPTSELYNPIPNVPLTGDLQRLWGALHPNQEWRSLGLSPQFPANAALAAQMWQTQMGQRVDGVLAVDVDGLRAILQATGPVSAGGRTVDATDVEQTLLKDQYVGLTDNATQNDPRREALGALAGAVLGSLQQPGVPFARLATQVAQAAAGRHFLAWAADPRIQAGWSAATVDGAVSGDGVLLGLNNVGANKLDPYQQIDVRMTIAPAGVNTGVTVAATISNQTPGDVSPYVAAGSDPKLAPGTYVGVAALDFPTAAGAARVDRPAVSASGRDYTSDVIAVPVALAPGESTTITWSFVLAGAHGRLTVNPSARLPSARWTTDRRTFRDAVDHTVAW